VVEIMPGTPAAVELRFVIVATMDESMRFGCFDEDDRRWSMDKLAIDEDDKVELFEGGSVCAGELFDESLGEEI
jgi:hypothetical protein